MGEEPVQSYTYRFNWQTRRLGVGIIWRFLHSHNINDALMSLTPWLGLSASCGLSRQLGLPHNIMVIFQRQHPKDQVFFNDQASEVRQYPLPPYSINRGIYKALSGFKGILDTTTWNVSGNISLQENHVGQGINLCGHVLVRVLQRTEPKRCVYIKKET